ncbi:MAG: hypothetical protein COA74_07075 [Gammaproteobacteria bacterium]|nr:MAG: hypothetical protein COA74_07075 [Gammaproteobacteria bacterium]
MANISFITIVKSALARYYAVLKQKMSHLRGELLIDPKGGFFWWLQTHRQKLALEQAMEELLKNARKPDFQLNQVTETLLSFKLKKDDVGQAKWYQDAHSQLLNCQKTLDGASILKREMIKPALTELKYISEAEQFHQYFHLQPMQRRVRDMYEAITERLDILLDYTKQKNQEHKTEMDVREQEAKLKLASELTRQHEIQLQKEEAELKIVETERELLDTQHEAEEASWNREAEQRKLSLQESQEKHRLQLQESLSDLNLDLSDGNNDGIVDVSGEQHLEALLRKLKNNELDRNDPKIKQQLQALLQAIAGL